MNEKDAYKWCKKTHNPVFMIYTKCDKEVILNGIFNNFKMAETIKNNKKNSYILKKILKNDKFETIEVI